MAFVLSAGMTGVGGALFALCIRSLDPDRFSLDITFTIVAMLVIGGVTSLSGAVVRSIAMTASGSHHERT